MPDYTKIVSNIDNADASVRKAEESMVPISRVKQVDAYILGLLQTVHLILAEAKKAALAADRTNRTIPPLVRKTLKLK